MTEEQIEEIKGILNAYCVAEDDGKYDFKMSTVEDSIITFDTDREFVGFTKTKNLGESILFDLDELQKITKACEDVLGWY